MEIGNKVIFFTLCLVVIQLKFVNASWGDSSREYRECNKWCIKHNCTNDTDLVRWSSSQPWPEYMIGLTCFDDCAYDCMWITTDLLVDRYGRVPQFHGRWPFVRIGGMTEPASVIFSLLNLVSNGWMAFWFVARVPSFCSMYLVWLGYAFTAVNAWIWSVVFHTRDTPLTEMLDYFCAFSTVLFSLYVFVMRMTCEAKKMGTLDPLSYTTVRSLITAVFVVFLSHHYYTMAFVRFDYGYNMRVNVSVGALNCLCWLGWFYSKWSEGPHVRLGLFTIVALTASVGLELLEFAPILWTLDSHALWHLATAPLPFLWFRFAAHDTLLLNQEKALHDALFKMD